MTPGLEKEYKQHASQNIELLFDGLGSLCRYAPSVGLLWSTSS